MSKPFRRGLFSRIGIRAGEPLRPRTQRPSGCASACRTARHLAMTRRAVGHVVDLALQGGGSHGAFTWGVLDALLDDGRLRLRWHDRYERRRDERCRDGAGLGWGGCGGAIRAKRARAALRRFWEGIGAQPSVFALQNALPGLARPPGAANPPCNGSTSCRALWSPYQWNPLELQPAAPTCWSG